MNDLLPDDFKSATWQRVESTLMKMRGMLSRQLQDPKMAPDETQVTRGRIQQINKLLALPRRGQSEPQED